MSLLGHSQSFSKGCDRLERCLSPGRKQMSSQSSKKPKMGSWGILGQAASPASKAIFWACGQFKKVTRRNQGGFTKRKSNLSKLIAFADAARLFSVMPSNRTRSNSRKWCTGRSTWTWGRDSLLFKDHVLKQIAGNYSQLYLKLLYILMHRLKNNVHNPKPCLQLVCVLTVH